MQLNLFAGQLYLRSYEEYLSSVGVLELCFRPPCEQTQVGCDGFVSPPGRPEFDAVMEIQYPFITSPVGSLKMLMAWRRKGQNYQKSHSGRFLRGKMVVKEQFRVKRFESLAISHHMAELYGGAHLSVPFTHLDTLYSTILFEGILNKR